MTERMPRAAVKALAYVLGVLTASSALATLAFAIANRSTIPDLNAADPIAIIVPLGFAVVGALVASRLPRNPTGWLFLGIGLVTGLAGLSDQYARLALITVPGSLPGATWALWLSSWVQSFAYPTGGAALLFLLLPNGHLPSRRWRPVAVATLLLAAFFVVPIGMLAPTGISVNETSSPMVQNPIGVSALSAISFSGSLVMVTVSLFVVSLLLLLVAGAAPLVRMRRSEGDERQQMKWIAYAIVVTVIVTTPLAIVTWGFAILPSLTWLTDLAISAGFGIALPVAAGVAIFKHHLYDIDIVISRTLVYGALAVFITAVYVGIAVGIGALIGGGGKPNLGLSILATAIVALGFQPVRERLQKVANRLVYGTRATPYEVLSEFSGRVAETYAAEDVLPRMARVLQEGTGAQSAVVWLRHDQQIRPAATHPQSAYGLGPMLMTGNALPQLPADRAVAVEHQGELLGALSVTKRRGESLTPLEAKLLDDLAHQAGLVIKNVGLTSQLMQRLEELRMSRQRLVQAQDEARRRLERNLHDGAQQHLVALKVKLGLVEMLAAKDPAKANEMLEQLKTDTDEALETLRDLARGIYPPLLADKGLGAALAAQARKGTVAVNIDADGIGRYAPDAEATVYFCVLEALQNVQKYAQASHAIVRVREEGGALRFVVEDDGQGFDPATAKKGAGLTNMADRLDAAGGSLDVASHPGQGTTVSGTLPVQVLVPA